MKTNSNTKVIGYTALHYGSDYLAWAIRSIIDHIDEYWVLYSGVGSHGHRTDHVCPDSRELLFGIANQAAGNKLRWVDGVWSYEGQQRDTIHSLVPDADAVVVLDADEIWPDHDWRGIVEGLYDEVDRYGTKSRVRMPIVHYWRSFYRCVLHDPAFPTRIIYPALPAGEMTASTLPINHMGYAQRSELVEYKQHTHGHKGEWRRDCDWFRDRFMANAQTDCHPVGSEYWNPEHVDPLLYMPEWMKDHPYYGLELIP